MDNGQGNRVPCPHKVKENSLYKSTTKAMSILLRHQLQVGRDYHLLVDDLTKHFNDSMPLLVNVPFELGEP